MIGDAIARLRRDTGVPADPDRRGPVPLQRFFAELNLEHFALSKLTVGGITEHLLADGVPVEPFGDADAGLAGFLFWAGRFGRAYVNADDILPRRRFTAAHELGHAVLHRDRMGQFIADTTVGEAGDAADPMEREADRFAAELLMPEDVVRARADELTRQHGVCPRTVLAYRLASELLVSREAMRYRLKALGVGDD